MVKKQTFLTPEDEARVVAAIGAAESRTSGEIRVHLTDRSQKPYDDAVAVFEKLGMTATAERNGVLIFLAAEDREFAVIGDMGIHNRISKDFWNDVRDAMAGDFCKGAFADGLCKGIALCGEQLEIHFPRTSNDRNELDDRLST